MTQVTKRLRRTTRSQYSSLKKYGPDSAEHSTRTEAQAKTWRLQKELKRVTNKRNAL